MLSEADRAPCDSKGKSQIRSLSLSGLRELRPSEANCDYEIYGLRVRCPIRLAARKIPQQGWADVAVVEGDPARFEAIAASIVFDPDDWIHAHELADGWSYIRYDEMFEFLIAPQGNSVIYRLRGKMSSGSFQTYLLGRVFSYVLVKMGHEPLHATTVVVDGGAVAFLGGSGFGKSSLAACFIAAGCPLLTDDVLRTEERYGRYLAFAGAPCLKLLPGVARLYLDDLSAGVPINNREASASKLLFPLAAEHGVSGSLPLRAIYVLTNPRKVYRRQRVVLASMTAREALMNLISFTHNDTLVSPQRMQHLLECAQRLSAAVPVRSLAYPRTLSALDEARKGVLADLAGHSSI